MGDGEADREKAAGPRVYTKRLPHLNQQLFGREAELAWLNECWEKRVHVATVVALGGVGKTALVKRWLADMRDAEWPGVARVYVWSFYSQGMDRSASSDEFIDAALRWFGDTDSMQGSPWDKGARLADLVRKERTLLVLDGVEPLQWGPEVRGRLKDPALEALVTGLSWQNNGLCVITTRIVAADLEALRGEKVRAKALDHLSPQAGAALLNACGAKGAKEDLEDASREFRGHGLSLTLLGGYIRKRHKGDIRQRTRIPLIDGEPAQRMMGVYERWFAGKPEMAILRMLGLFDRPAGKDEISALRAKPPIPGLTTFLKGLGPGVWNDALTTLQDVGLLVALSEDEEVLDAHPLVREYFARMLRHKHPEAWREGHRRLYEHLKKKAEPLPETIEEMRPLYAAVVHGCMAGKHQEALDDILWKRIYRRSEGFNWKKLGAFGSEVALFSAFFDPPWERLAYELSDADTAWVLNNAGFALRALGRLPEAAGLVRLAVDHSIAQSSWRNAAFGAGGLSELLHSRGDLSGALAQGRKSVEFADKSGGAKERIVNRTTPAATLHAMGRQKEASALFEEAERLQKDIQPASPRLYSLQGFRYCDLLLDQGRDAEVRERAAQALNWAGAYGGLLDIALDHLSLGRAYLLVAQRNGVGDLAQTASHLTQAVDGLRRYGDQSQLPLGLLARAALHIQIRAFDLAHRDLAEALSLAQRCGFRLHEADAHLGYARLHLAEEHPDRARSYLADARRLITETGYHRRDEELTELEAQCAEEEKRTARAPGTQGTADISAPLPLVSVAPLAVHSDIGSPPATSTPSIATTTPTPPSPARPMLDAAEILQLQAAIISAGLVNSREALMAGIDAVFVAGLPTGRSAANQVMMDLDELSKAGALADGTVPLHTWLDNAAQLAGLRVEAAVFERYQRRKKSG